MKTSLKSDRQDFSILIPSKVLSRYVFGIGILLLFLSPPNANAALLWDWHYVGNDNSLQQGTFVTPAGNINDPNTIYTVTEFQVIRSDAGRLSFGAPLGSTTDGTYHAFGDVPVKFRIVGNEFIFGPDLGGRYDTAYDSPNGYHIFLFANIPDQPLTGEGYLYYNPPGGPQQCCNNGQVFTSGLKVIIDIKPGSYPNSINLAAAGVIPVAILSSADFG